MLKYLHSINIYCNYALKLILHRVSNIKKTYKVFFY